MDASDTRAALAAMTHPADDHDDEDAIEPETETAPVDVIAAEAEDAESVPTPALPSVARRLAPSSPPSSRVRRDPRRRSRLPSRQESPQARRSQRRSDGASDSDDDHEFSLGSATRRSRVRRLARRVHHPAPRAGGDRDARVEQPMDRTRTPARRNEER